MKKYDSNKHALLCQTAHRALLTPEEFPRFVEIVQKGVGSGRVFEVKLPDWPPVKYAPLALIFGLGDGEGNGSAWWVGRTWTGVQWAVDTPGEWIDDPDKEGKAMVAKIVRNIAKDMAGDRDSKERLAYQWNVPAFNPNEHIILRYWLEEKGLDITDFYKKHFPQFGQRGEEAIFEVTNPRIKEEKASGSYSPTRRAIHSNDYDILNTFQPDHIFQEYETGHVEGSVAKLPPAHLGVIVDSWEEKHPFYHPVGILPQALHRENGTSPLVLRSHPDGSGEVRAWGDRALIRGMYINHQRVIGFRPWNDGWRAFVDPEMFVAMLNLSENIPAPDPDPEYTPILEPENNVEFVPNDALLAQMVAGSQTYAPDQVIDALTQAFGRPINLFGDRPSDSSIIGIRGIDAHRFLREDSADRDEYVKDTGGRNWDCENFSERLRVSFQSQTGINGIGVVWGDVHAWNFFVIAGEEEPRLLFIEPQDDRIIKEFTGQYAVERHLDVLL